MMTTSMTKAITRRTKTPSNSSGLGRRVVGMRFDVGPEASGGFQAGRRKRLVPEGLGAEIGHGQLCIISWQRLRVSLDNDPHQGVGDGPVKVTLADIEAARRVIAGHVLRTPMLPAPPLSALTGADVYVKYENLQVTNSFKDRGACVKLAALSDAERRRGVIAMSAGNHAQAVAYHAQAPGDSGDHRHAGDDPVCEGQGDRSAWRRESCCAARPWSRRRRAPRAIAAEHDLRLGPSL